MNDHKLIEDNDGELIDLGAASDETRSMTSGADDHKAGLWLAAGLLPD